MVHQLTVRYDEELAREIEELARREGISRNQATLRLLRKGARLDAPDSVRETIGDSLDRFIGSWSEEQARELAGGRSSPRCCGGCAGSRRGRTARARAGAGDRAGRCAGRLVACQGDRSPNPFSRM